jgi:hypothetical protein
MRFFRKPGKPHSTGIHAWLAAPAIRAAQPPGCDARNMRPNTPPMQARPTPAACSAVALLVFLFLSSFEEEKHAGGNVPPTDGAGRGGPSG